MKRLFFALWPNDQTRQHCMQVMNRLPTGQQQLVDVNNLHVTLVFIGSVDSTLEETLIRIGGELPVSDMLITFDQLTFWRKPKILCLTGHSQNKALPLLVEQLSSRVQPLPIKLDERPYQAHVTLARKAERNVNIAFEPITWHANTFCLVESCSLPQGVRYQVLHTWPTQRSTLYPTP